VRAGRWVVKDWYQSAWAGGLVSMLLLDERIHHFLWRILGPTHDDVTDGNGTRGETLPSIILKDLLSQKILYLSLVPQHFEVSALQQLGPAIMQLLPDILLDARIVDLPLPGR
jgi:hypothetical protein